MTSTVSVALATFNGARFLEEQLASILDQSQAVTEIVVSDDGSTDGTVEIARRAAEVDRRHRITVLPGPSGSGVAGNFARALAACTGDLIALSDQDDIWRHDRVAVAADEFAGRPELLLLGSDAALVDEAGRPLGATLLDSLRIPAADLRAIHEGNALDPLLRRNLFTGATCMMRRQLLDDAGEIPAGWIHDEWLAVIAALRGGADLLETPLIDYRQHGGNAIGIDRPGLRNDLRRILSERRGPRVARLTLRAENLHQRMPDLPFAVDDGQRARITAKALHEQARAALPAPRLARLGPVVREYRTGRYERYSSRGRADVARDLLQRA